MAKSKSSKTNITSEPLNKECKRCGRKYNDLKEWKELVYVGDYDANGGVDDTPDILEVRNCKCGSTLSVRIDQ